jgi:transcriptional regulator with XRE-family HTH domain
MTEQPDTAALPRWDLADKMRKSLRHAGLSVQDMADYLDVDRSTVSTWINGRIDPSSQTMKLWALRTGIAYTWFCHGSLEPCDLGPQPVTNGTSSQVRRRVNNMHYSQVKIAS